MTNIKKYTGSYANTENNFVIENINTNESIDNTTLFGVFCVVENIIKRGKVSRPSKYLQKAINWKDYRENHPLKLISKYRANWRNIKGDAFNLDYPASVFFEELFPKYLKEKAALRNLIAPEVLFQDIIKQNTAFDGQQVDFYFPQIKTVIEIDGASHMTDLQKEKDSKRDEVLEKHGNRIIRIKAKDIKEENNNFKEKMSMLIGLINNSDELNEYLNNKSIEKDERIDADFVYRIQMVILECLRNGKIPMDKKKQKICIATDEKYLIQDKLLLAKYAYTDIKKWSECIMQLLKEKHELPDIQFVCDGAADFTINISMRKRYTDSDIKNNKTIYVRTDYFDNDYYKVCTSNEMLKYNFPFETENKDLKALTYLLDNIFGFELFNEGQIEIIKAGLTRNDTIGILPTGGGKSLTYQMIALLQPGITIVIEPIISLIKDQKMALYKLHFDRSASITSDQIGEEKESIVMDFRKGKYHMLFCSPERFQNEKFIQSFSMNADLFPLANAVIDEVHCLSEWGHDFRVSYLSLIGTLRSCHPDVCLVGLTATASQLVLEDLKVEFGIDGSAVKALPSMIRKELKLKRIRTYNYKKLENIKNIVIENQGYYVNLNGEKKKKLGLIFCLTTAGKNINSCENVVKTINSIKPEVKHGTYNGKLSSISKNVVQERFMNDEFDIVVCTKAFGMGIDKENVKYTIHCGHPASIEAFYQEAGRAGRDRDKSVLSICYILYDIGKGVSKEIYKMLFDPQNTIKDRLSASMKFSGDISTHLYFWRNQIKTVEEELKNIDNVLNELKSGQTDLSFNNTDGKGNTLNSIQGSLYKIYLLGIIDNWSISYQNLNYGIVNVPYLGINLESVFKRLLAYIRKYDTEFHLDSKTNSNAKYYDILNNSKRNSNGDKNVLLKGYFKILIEWYNDNIMYNRLMALKTIYDWMSPAISDEMFERKIDNYFRFSENTIQFDGLVKTPLDFNLWYKVLFKLDNKFDEIEKPITVEAASNALASLQRYLESYRNNTGLNLLSGMLRIATGEFKDSGEEWRFREALNNIKKSFNQVEKNRIIDRLLDFIEPLSLEKKEVFSIELISIFPDSYLEVFRKLNDRYSLSIALEEPVDKIKDIVEELF